MSILDGIKLLSTLTESERNKLELFCQEKHLCSGETLFKEGDDASAMYMLKSGKINVLKDIEGKKLSIGEVSAEEILGEMALFNQTNKRMATAVGLTDCSLVVILFFSLKELTEKHPELGEKIMNIIKIRENINKERLKK